MPSNLVNQDGYRKGRFDTMRSPLRLVLSVLSKPRAALFIADK